MNCPLPKVVKHFCQTGCIYREKAFRHLACPVALKNKAFCVAPAPPPPNPIFILMKTNNRIKTNTQNNDEVHTLQKINTY
jgi:hypothetical protein